MLQADIYVIQECENPQKYPEIFRSLKKQFFWTGMNDNKGLGLFAEKNIRIIDNHWDNYALKHFASYHVNDAFDLLCVWTSAPSYIEEFFIYQTIHQKEFHDNMVIIGDFNSNSIWDTEHRERNHSETVKQLHKIGLVSAYHYLTKERQGEETQPTFFQYRDSNKPFHIDYCFTKADFIKDFHVLDECKWLQYSDHLPIQLDIRNV